EAAPGRVPTSGFYCITSIVFNGGAYTTASQVRQCQLVCPPPCPRHATSLTKTWFGPRGARWGIQRTPRIVQQTIMRCGIPISAHTKSRDPHMHSIDEAERVHYLLRDGSDMCLVCTRGCERHCDKLRALDIQVGERKKSGSGRI